MDRRDFLKQGVLASVGVGLGVSSLFAASCAGANDRIVLALVGSGGRGLSCIISCCKINKNVTIKTVCDVNSTKLAKAVAEVEKELGYRPGATGDMRTIFDDKDVDAVWVATPEH